MNASKLMMLVRAGDRNKNGVIDRREFMIICDKIVDELEDIHEKSLHKIMADSKVAASRERDLLIEKMRRDHPARAPLPWGWTYQPPGRFHDRISGYHTNSRKPLDTPYESFSCMAYLSAPECLRRIRLVRDVYVGQNVTDPNHLNALETMQRAALKFTILEDQNAYDASSSDLDEMSTELRIFSAVEPLNPLLPSCPAETLFTVHIAYESLLSENISFIYSLCGATHLTEHFGGSFDKAWAARRLSQRARLVAAKLSTWDSIEEEVKKCRQWYMNHSWLHELVVKIANPEYKAEAERVKSQKDIFRNIREILEVKEPPVRLQIRKARNLPKLTGRWGKRSVLPDPFARIHTANDQMYETNTDHQTVNPLWTDPWVSISIGQAGLPVPLTSTPRITISSNTSKGETLNLAWTDPLKVDDRLPKDPPSGILAPTDFTFRGESLYEAFSGGFTQQSIKSMEITNNPLGEVEIYLEPSGPILTVGFAWDGLVNLVREHRLPLVDFLVACPKYRGIFPEEGVEASAVAQLRLQSEFD